MKWSFFLLSIASFLTTEIREIRTITELKRHLEPDALLLFDLDNTIMEAAQTLGSDQWFTYRQKHYEKLNYSFPEALENALAEWMAIQNLTQVQIVEKEVIDLIHEFQQEGRALMGLTTRGLGMALRTVEQLKTLSIDLSKTAPFQEEKLLITERGVLFRQGILFTAGTDKGNAFLLLFKDQLPQKVLFINDKASHLKEVEKACNEAQIPFIGLRYGFLDEKVQNFSPEIAAIQWEHFGRILGDEEAVKMLRD